MKRLKDDLNYYVHRKFISVQCYQLEAHVYCHTNFIKIKLVKIDSFVNVITSPILMFTFIYSIVIYFILMSFLVKIILGFILLLFSCLLTFYFNVVEESLEIIKSINGVNYTTKNMLGKKVSKFINSSNFVINEAITMSQVISYLAVLTCESSKLTSSRQVNLILTHLLPRNDCLTFIYTHIHSFLNDEKINT
ncbi:phosphatidylinositol N-acetylglucosaminyltransferase subunit H-like isoform X2 [Panonychus citri]|uniref:phosphatidylinositol N-acetylglucosaminyltransferase subunit H-like isoform X2 n=1 Tax=Panonychus citri TaxID=50023 RepID=UPI002307EC9F|nr:phosphatidylinositol N-acetylglucosaminyltransferase subunit H-like isoform X2 [Panonychus citri]